MSERTGADPQAAAGVTQAAETDELLALSGLQHLAFCPRQWGLIHLEQSWQENRLTAEGKQLHERVDLPGQSRREQVRSVRGMWLRSERLGLYGRADLVEFSPGSFPVEYKRGKRKPNDCDAVQLCAQALCLEEMLAQPVERGAFFYGDPRRRLEVRFTPELRARTASLAELMRTLFRSGLTPAATPGPYCKNCSLVHICLPESCNEDRDVRGWIARQTRALESEPAEDDSLL